MSSLFDLRGKTAIVTGASTGLGQGMSLGLAEAGADVVLVDYVESTETDQKIRALGRRTLMIVANLMEMSSIGMIVEKTLKEFGKVDILVNNAGIIRRTPAIDFSEKDWDEVMLLNSKTVFFFSQGVARDMMKRKEGKIINVASLLSFQGGITVPSYAASKGAVAQVTKALANEWAKHGINVNAIAPGYMATNNTKALREDPVRSKAILDRIPAERWGLPSDLAGVAVFLASHASDYVNGHVLVVDGGWLAR
ncbi:MAG: 2-dehydro-3-deoxy-D-gluconate 5-dehydrogenase KduD [Ignavibacteriae bacterium]|nr:2-dehydro-3-deoxy-D-gluconate 5-dehydrogenase KduD [Ignavibacteriota bacterium]